MTLTDSPVLGTQTVHPCVLPTMRCAYPLLIADDHELVRFAIRSALDTLRPDMFAPVEATTLTEALHVYRALSPSALVLLDLTMPDCRGLQGLRRFRSAHPAARLLVIGGAPNDVIAAQVRALGAAGFASKHQSAPDLVRTIVQLCGLDDDAPRGVPKPGTFPSGARLELASNLSARHLEVLDLLLFGLSNQAIADATGLSVGTVKNYVSAVLEALDVRSRAHLLSLFT